jgi:peptidoglycan/LPS O-acetylase OafA/YrhL
MSVAVVDAPAQQVHHPTIRAFRPDVEGLRAVAILTVVLYHYKLPPFRGGYIGVDVFFVISGFVITQMLLRERQKTAGTSIADFYARRIRRIVPAATVTLIVTTVASYLILGASAQPVSADARAAALFYSNIHFANTLGNYLNVGTSTSPLLHFWSLSIEEQFYLFWPSLFVAICVAFATIRRSVKLELVLTAIVVASLGYSIHLTSTDPTAAYYSSLGRAGELALGALCAVLLPRFIRLHQGVASVISWLGLCGIFISAVMYDDHTAFPGWAVLLPVFATATVIVASPIKRPMGAEAVLALRPVLWLGAISYSLYLWHWPVYQLTVDKVGYVPSWPWRVVLLSFAVAVAAGTYYLYENPIRRSSFLRNARHLTFVLGGCLIAGTIAVTYLAPNIATADPLWTGSLIDVRSQHQLNSLLRSSSSLSTLPPLVYSLTAPPDWANDRGCLISYTALSATGTRPSNAQCTWGDLRSSRVVALVGDSHAAMWIDALSKVGRAEHFKVIMFARAGCHMSALPLWDYPAGTTGVGCTKFNEWMPNAVAATHPIAVVAADSSNGGDRNYAYKVLSQAEYESGFAAEMHRFPPHTLKILLGPQPYPSQDPSVCLLANPGGIQRCGVQRGMVASEEGLVAVEIAAQEAGARFVDVNKWFCTSQECPPVVDHVYVYLPNRFHVSKHYSMLIYPAIQQSLRSVGLS